MEPIIYAIIWSWMILCVVIDVMIYKRTRSWRIRWIPAIVKLTAAGLCFLVNFLLPDPPMVPENTPLLYAVAIVLLMGVLIDVWAWFFSGGLPTKRKLWIYACGVGIGILIGIIGLFAEGEGYRVSSSGGFRHYTFEMHTGEISKTLNYSEDEPEWCFTFDAEEGTLELLVTDESGHILYSGTPEDPSEFVITSTGTIRITITTEAFTGKLHADRIDSDRR